MSPDPAQLLPSAVEIPPVQLREAVVNEDATEAGQLIKCVEPGHTINLASDPLQWTPYVTEAGVFYPKRGDRAIIATPEGGPPYMSDFWPATDAVADFSF